jgi:hypothetical protein
MTDPTESIRREMVAEINADPGRRAALEAKHGQVWDTSELQLDFEALGFAQAATAAQSGLRSLRTSISIEARNLKTGLSAACPSRISRHTGPRSLRSANRSPSFSSSLHASPGQTRPNWSAIMNRG